MPNPHTPDGVAMICPPCAHQADKGQRFHVTCQGGTWCDCQHNGYHPMINARRMQRALASIGQQLSKLRPNTKDTNT